MDKKLCSFFLLFTFTFSLSPSPNDDFLLEVFRQDEWGFVKDRLVTAPKLTYNEKTEKMVYGFLSLYAGGVTAFATSIIMRDLYNLGRLFGKRNLFIVTVTTLFFYWIFNEKIIKKHVAKRDTQALKRFLDSWEQFQLRTPEVMRSFFASLAAARDQSDDDESSFYADICKIIRQLLEKRKKAKTSGESLDVEKALDEVLEYFGIKKVDQS